MLFHPIDGRGRRRDLAGSGDGCFGPTTISFDGFNVSFHFAGVLVTALGLFLQRVQDDLVEADVYLDLL